MKKILLIIAILGFILPASAQTFNGKSAPANSIGGQNAVGHQGFNYLTGNICGIVSGTVTPIATGKLDTLNKGGGTIDTGYVQFTVNGCYNTLFDLAAKKISGTAGGTAILQGSTDNSTWYTLTGVTTYCASCSGASATVTNTAGTTHYQWFLPKDATNYPFYQIRYITTDTSGKSTYTATAGYKN